MGTHTTDTTDWANNYAPGSRYAAQVEEVAKRLSGADVVVPIGGQIRTSGRTNAIMQPPAAEAHVDFTQRCAERIAGKLYRKSHPDGRGYRRLIAFSLWRALSEPPQDMPLALCDGRSVRDDEGTHKYQGRRRRNEGEENMSAATIFHYSAAHRWWYYPDMRPEEVIFIKFYDSDHSKAWRCPHTAFRDVSRAEAAERRSIEFRGIAYFTI